MAIAAALEALWPRPTSRRRRPGTPRRRVEVQRALVEPADPAAPRPTLGLTTAPDRGRRADHRRRRHRATFHDGTTVEHLTGLEPDAEHEHHGITFRTLPTPPGPLRCRIGTVNDVHFGEIEAGRIDDNPLGPIRRVGAR